MTLTLYWNCHYCCRRPFCLNVTLENPRDSSRMRGVYSTWRQHGETCPETAEWNWCHKALSSPPSSWWRSPRLVGCVTNRLQEELHQQDTRPFTTRHAKWWPHHISSFVYSELGCRWEGRVWAGSAIHIFVLWGLQSHLLQRFKTCSFWNHIAALPVFEKHCHFFPAQF